MIFTQNAWFLHNTVVICLQCKQCWTKIRLSIAFKTSKCVVCMILFSKNLNRTFLFMHEMDHFFSPLEILEMRYTNKALGKLQGQQVHWFVWAAWRDSMTNDSFHGSLTIGRMHSCKGRSTSRYHDTTLPTPGIEWSAKHVLLLHYIYCWRRCNILSVLGIQNGLQGAQSFWWLHVNGMM